jgi:hypothetical protein
MAKLIEVYSNSFINHAGVAPIDANGSKSDVPLVRWVKLSFNTCASDLVKKLSVG